MKQPGNTPPSTDIDFHYFNAMVMFIDEVNKPVVDISTPSVKMDYISTCLGTDVDYIYDIDYNFDSLGNKKYKTIFCFEVIEHLQNPLLFLRNIKSIMHKDSVLYVAIPCRPKLLWPKFHYNEIGPKMFEKWLLDPLDLQIEKKQYYRFRKGLSYKIGIRPLIRFFMIPWNGEYFYKIKIK